MDQKDGEGSSLESLHRKTVRGVALDRSRQEQWCDCGSTGDQCENCGETLRKYLRQAGGRRALGGGFDRAKKQGKINSTKQHEQTKKFLMSSWSMDHKLKMRHRMVNN